MSMRRNKASYPHSTKSWSSCIAALSTEMGCAWKQRITQFCSFEGNVMASSAAEDFMSCCAEGCVCVFDNGFRVGNA